VSLSNPLVHPAEAEVILAGDVCYEARMTARVVPWLREAAGRGVAVLLADPGRAYLPRDGLEPLACYQVAVTRELEDRLVRDTTVYRVLP
jgi:predicted nicotinamide N-methyase